jgi:hypothetical protein
MTSLALVVIGNGRLPLLLQAVHAANRYIDADYYLMVDDSGDKDVHHELFHAYPEFYITSHITNRGMAAAVQSGFNLVRDTDATHIFWLEEDMVLTGPPPVEQAIIELTKYPRLSQMLFERQPLSPEEQAGGSVHSALNAFHDYGNWVMHRTIFSLNPCIIPRHIIDHYDWPSGPIGVGNETGMTRQLLADGYTFGCWKGEMVEHIGWERGAAWQL